ncbi:MAG: hypothetical protein ACOX2F_09245 [bacterium]
MRKKLVALAVLFVFFEISAVNFDFSESYDRFLKGHSVGASISPVYEGDSTLLELDFYGSFYFDMLRFGFLLPVRFILYNNNNIETTAGVFPKEDWDDARDFVAIITFFQYGFKGDLFYFYFGEQENRYAGNGTILGGYFNNIKLRFPKRGVSLEINSDYAGFDFFMDDVSFPNVMGGRAYLKPVSFFSKESYGNNLEIGFSYFSDVYSPYKISTLYDSGVPKRDFERYSDHVFGVDLNFRYLATSLYHGEVYSDINKILDGGTGIHLGLEHKFILSSKNDMEILSKWEYRAMQSNYIPSYFNTFYDIEREYYRNGQTKSRFVNDSSRKNLDWTHGYYLDLVFHFTGVFAVGGSFEHNRIYKSDVKLGKFDNYQLNLLANVLLFNNKFGLDFVMTFQELGEKGKRLSSYPFYSVSAYYKLYKYLTIGAFVSSKWYLDYRGAGTTSEFSYKGITVVSGGAYGSFSF